MQCSNVTTVVVIEHLRRWWCTVSDIFTYVVEDLVLEAEDLGLEVEDSVLEVEDSVLEVEDSGLEV